MAKKEKQPEGPVNVNEQLSRELAEHKLTSLIKLADEQCDMEVQCVSTGFPQLDYALHPVKRGFPLRRDIEIYSKDPEVGKTSLGLEFIGAAQQAGLRVADADIERTQTQELFDMYRIITDPFEDPTKYALRMIRYGDEAIPAEEILEGIRTASNLFDVILVDSVAALESKANLEKDVKEGTQTGGLSKMLSEFTRKNIAKRATIVWINQMRMKIGKTMAGAPPPHVTTGGKALPFYASIRLELSLAFPEPKIKVGDEIVGMNVRVFTAKNKIAPQWKSCDLSYLFGRGFSRQWDYLQMAKKLGAIEKSSSWLNFGDFKAQGDVNFVNAMYEKPELFDAVKTVVDSDGKPAEEVTENAPPPAEVAEAEAVQPAA
jgi:recombination protein RecA